MPQIDFGRAFSNPQKHDSSPANGESGARGLPPDDGDSHAPVAPARFRRSRLGRSEWTNIIFTIIAVLGGLFCAFYFFNGAELLRTAGRWPREFLYSRPSPNDPAENALAQLAEALGLPALPDTKTDSNHGGDPFSHAGGLLALQPNSAHSATAGRAGAGFTSGAPGIPGVPIGGLPGPGSLLSGLGLPAPGGDALTQAFNHAVADLQQIAKRDAQRTVVVVHNAVTRTEKHLGNMAKNTAQGAQRAVNNVTGQTTARIGGTQQAAAATAGSATSAGGAAVSGAQQTLGSTGRALSGAASGLAGARGGGGLGGLGGLGGGLGGLSGGVGGLGGRAGGFGGGGHGRGH